MTTNLQHHTLRIVKIWNISRILIKEHLQEPTALLWTGLAPCLMFMIVTSNYPAANQAYRANAAWFYAYIAANVAFFGLSFYLIGRRESGFIRSFIYQRNAIFLFLLSHATSYTVISLIYCSVFYLTTKPLYGEYSFGEYLQLTTCFYTSYLIFSCIGLIIAALPIKFSTAGTLFSLMSFLMLASGYAGSMHGHGSYHGFNLINPLYLTTQIVNGALPLLTSFMAALTASTAGLLLTAKYFRIQPIWSRYS